MRPPTPLAYKQPLGAARAPAEATPTRRGRKRAYVTVQPAGSGSAPSEIRCCEVASVPGVRANDSRLPTSEVSARPGAGVARWPRGLALSPREVAQVSPEPTARAPLIVLDRWL